ncbi:MAG: tetratricopeptide repeat protein [Verrucomicrobia bacterium]|nr:tetratricopeptide repeat protein [Verrucomicrobiota bacterium]
MAAESPTANPVSSIQNPSASNPPSTIHPPLSTLPPPPSDSADSGKNHPGPGDLLFRSGQYDKALPLYQQQLATASDAETGGHALFHIGQCLTVLHRYPDAVGAFDNLLVKFPTSSWADDAMLRKGSVQAGLLKNPQAGITTWLDLLKKYPKSNLVPEARFLAGMLDWIGGQKSRAKETWRVLIRDFPDHPRAEQAQLYLGEKRP